MKKVLITGASGFIGRALVDEITKSDIEIIALMRKSTETNSKFQNNQKIRIVYCDMDEIEQLPQLIDDRDIDCCIHLAWAGSTGETRADASLQLKNVDWSVRLIKVLGKMKVLRFVGAGTLAEQDVLNYHPLDGATPNAVSMYGIAKITAHFMSKTQCCVEGIEHIWCVISNTYGIGNTTNNFINFASKLMLEKKHAAFTAGEQYYDFVYITDTARAFWAAACRGKSNSSYYLGSTKSRKLKDYILIIKDTIDPSISLFLGEIPFNGKPLPPESFDCSSLVADTGYKPTIPFEIGIEETINWLKMSYYKNVAEEE